MFIPNDPIPVKTNPKYNYLKGENEEQTHFLQVVASNMGEFGKLPWSLEQKYHKLIHDLLADGIDHTHPDFPKTEKQAEALLKKYSTDDRELKEIKRQVKSKVDLKGDQLKNRIYNQNKYLKSHGYTAKEIEAFRKAKGRGLVNLVGSDLLKFMKLEGR